MIGMGFGSFFVCLIFGVIASLVVNFGFRYRVLGKVDSFFAQWVGGWFGAWLGPAVAGHWSATIAGIHWVPSLIGAFVGAFTPVAVFKALAYGRLGTPIGLTERTADVTEVRPEYRRTA